MTESVAPGEEQERQRARDQRAVLGGVLRRADRTARPTPAALRANRESGLVPPVALEGPFGHRVRIGRGGVRALSARQSAAGRRARPYAQAVTVPEALAILAAGLAAGTINTVVGSGSLITFPVLLAFGYPPVTANVSNNIGLVPGSISGVDRLPRASCAGQRGAGDLARAARRCSAARPAPSLLLALPPSWFEAIVPVFIAIALVLVVLQPRLSAALVRAPGRAARARRPARRSRACSAPASTAATSARRRASCCSRSSGSTVDETCSASTR